MSRVTKEKTVAAFSSFINNLIENPYALIALNNMDMLFFKTSLSVKSVIQISAISTIIINHNMHLVSNKWTWLLLELADLQ